VGEPEWALAVGEIEPLWAIGGTDDARSPSLGGTLRSEDIRTITERRRSGVRPVKNII
jgi:hypothetical protein